VRDDTATRPRPPTRYLSRLGPILAMAERRFADRTAYVDLIADAMIRQQSAVEGRP
jgi:hypothetical protein